MEDTLSLTKEAQTWSRRLIPIFSIPARGTHARRSRESLINLCLCKGTWWRRITSMSRSCASRTRFPRRAKVRRLWVLPYFCPDEPWRNTSLCKVLVPILMRLRLLTPAMFLRWLKKWTTPNNPAVITGTVNYPLVQPESPSWCGPTVSSIQLRPSPQGEQIRVQTDLLVDPTLHAITSQTGPQALNESISLVDQAMTAPI